MCARPTGAAGAGVPSGSAAQWQPANVSRWDEAERHQPTALYPPTSPCSSWRGSLGLGRPERPGGGPAQEMHHESPAGGGGGGGGGGGSRDRKGLCEGIMHPSSAVRKRHACERAWKRLVRSFFTGATRGAGISALQTVPVMHNHQCGARNAQQQCDQREGPHGLGEAHV